MPPKPIAWWIHLTVGLVVVAVASQLQTSAAIPICAVIYVAWSARALAGLFLALVAGLLELHALLAFAGPSIRTVVVAAAWLAGYVAIAGVTAAVEAATRPERR